MKCFKYGDVTHDAFLETGVIVIRCLRLHESAQEPLPSSRAIDHVVATRTRVYKKKRMNAFLYLCEIVYIRLDVVCPATRSVVHGRKVRNTKRITIYMTSM